MADRLFQLHFDGTVGIYASELWPDGDGPDDPTVEDVEQLVQDSGPIESLIGDWNLADNINIHVSGKRRR